MSGINFDDAFFRNMMSIFHSTMCLDMFDVRRIILQGGLNPCDVGSVILHNFFGIFAVTILIQQCVFNISASRQVILECALSILDVRVIAHYLLEISDVRSIDSQCVLTYLMSGV